MPMLRQFGKSQLVNQLMTDNTGLIPNMRHWHSNNGNYLILKSWTAGRGRQMHRVQVRYNVLEWLRAEYDQSNEQTPSWWVFQGHDINITDDMLTVLLLRW